jgi:hypothetical protein
MRCEEARPLISAELDEELDGICAGRLRTHLAECVLCSTERDTLAATVRLLRALPETEPPAALRRRIGAALLDVERASQRRQPGLAWLARPSAPGWAWGAALGATVAAVALLAPHRQAAIRRVAALPHSTRAAGPVQPAPVHSDSAAPGERWRVVAVPEKALTTEPRHALPSPADHLDAALPPLDSSLAASTKPSSAPATLASPVHRQVIRTHAVRRVVRSTHHASPAMPAPLAMAHGMPSRSAAPADRSVRSNDDSVRQARTVPPASIDPSTPQPSDQDPRADTAAMTQMASGGAMPAPQETGNDDLAELRRRLTDRPLQVPELGQLKPATSTRSSRDGWIRF